MSDAPFPRVYEGIWGVLVGVFRVPHTPPTLPAGAEETIDVFRAAPGYLRYRRLGYWVGFWVVLIALLGGLAVLTAAAPPVGILVAVPAFLLFACLAMLNYVAVYLEYDTTWYAVGSEGVRTRGGVWTNREITIRYENVQNVSTSQGPLQRRFGISNVRVDTAGLASSGNQYEGAKATGVSLRGLSNAEDIKELIRARCDASPSAGLGEEDSDAIGTDGRRWSEAHLAILREIRDAAGALKDG